MTEQPPQTPNIPEPLYDVDTRLFLPMARVCELYSERYNANSTVGYTYWFEQNTDKFVEFVIFGFQREKVNGKSIWTYQLQLRYPFKYSNHSECNPNIIVREDELLTENDI